MQTFAEDLVVVLGGETALEVVHRAKYQPRVLYVREWGVLNKLKFIPHKTNAKVIWDLHPEVIRTIYIVVVAPVILYAAATAVER